METLKAQTATQPQKLMIFVLTMGIVWIGDAVHRTDPQFSGGNRGIFRGIFSVYSVIAGHAV